MARHRLTMLIQPRQGKRSGLTRLDQHGRLAGSHQSTRRDHFKRSHFPRLETLQNWSKVGLPVGTGRSPYGWNWKDKEKTAYVVNQEQAAVRVSIFHMYVELDMSLRAIMHKLTEDRILTPTYANKFQVPPPEDEEIPLEHCLWRFTTIRELLQDLENIGILVVCKQKQTIGPDGRRKVEVHPNRREVPGGIPAIIDPAIFERAQEKLKTNKVDKSHLPLNKEDYLLRGHIYCAMCGCSMKPRTQKKGRLTQKGTDKSYPFYRCTNMHNRYGACPAMTNIRTSPLDEIVWQECCVLFKRIDVLQAALKQEMEASHQRATGGYDGTGADSKNRGDN